MTAASSELTSTRNKLIQNLQKQTKHEVDLLKSSMLNQLKRSIDVEKMPSVRVRPTLRAELKHRVMICKVPESAKTKDESINIETLTETVLDVMKRSKRANMGG